MLGVYRSQILCYYGLGIHIFSIIGGQWFLRIVEVRAPRLLGKGDGEMVGRGR